MSGGMTLYHGFPFRGTRCAWLVYELGLDPNDENAPIKFHKMTVHAAPEVISDYKQNVHPYGTIPALVIHEENGKTQTMLESAAICLFLAQKFGDGKLLPSNPSELPNYYNWIVHGASTVDGALEPLYLQLTHTPEDKRDQALIVRSRARFQIFCETFSHFLNNGVINGEGEEREFICGNQFTAADCVIGYNIWWASAIDKGSILASYPSLVRYLDRLKERPAFQKAFSRS